MSNENDPTPPSPDDNELLLEQTLSAWRPRDVRGQIEFHPAWRDLDDAWRAKAFDRTIAQRRLEAAMDPEGLSSTARAVLARIEKR